MAVINHWQLSITAVNSKVDKITVKSWQKYSNPSQMADFTNDYILISHKFIPLWYIENVHTTNTFDEMTTTFCCILFKDGCTFTANSRKMM